MTSAKTDLLRTVNNLETEEFTGKLEVSSASHERWQLFFYLGKLVWADGGLHPNRSWRRLFKKYCHHLNLKKITVNSLEEFENCNYQILSVLLEQKDLEIESAKSIARDRIDEILFEIVEHQTIESLSYKPFNLSTYGLSLFKLIPILLKPTTAVKASQQKWALWTQNSLGPYSPNLAPTIAELERLEKEVNSSVYQNFVTLLDGHNTLRDLALQMQSDPMTITCSLLPYINRNFIQLSEVGDIKLPIELVVANHPTLSSRKPSTPTIACIDDSLQISLVMEQIMLKAGYKFLGIQQPLQAIPQLISQPPDLIFLDVRMPIINGYELCSQIRRISQLEKIPIIMLTGQDGIVDRMRAKLVGACDFVSKPIDDKKIIKVVEKFLSEFDAPILQ